MARSRPFELDESDPRALCILSVEEAPAPVECHCTLDLVCVQNLELDLIARRTDLLIARIDLYRAIGGTWTEELEAPDMEKMSKTGN